MKITLLFFAGYRSQTGIREQSLEIAAGSTVKQVAADLETKHPGLVLKGALAAVNETYATPEQVLKPDDTLAFFPPVSGGSGSNDHLLVTEDTLDETALANWVKAPAYGANASFSGTVRSPNQGEVVRHIDYEGYEAMMYTQMKEVAKTVRSRYRLGRLVLAHRLGRLQAGETSIFIAVSSAHRKEALTACQEALDLCKERLPVWKLEVGDRSETWVPGSNKATTPL